MVMAILVNEEDMHAMSMSELPHFRLIALLFVASTKSLIQTRFI